MPAVAPLEPPKVKHPGRQGRVVPLSFWRWLAVVSATFTLAVAASMLVGYRRAVAEDPIGAQQIAVLRERLHATPKDEALKKPIRELDLRERERYFAHLQRNSSGGWMLLIGGAFFVLAASQFQSRKQMAPLPRPLTDAKVVEREATRARFALIGTGTVIVATIAAIGVLKPVRSVVSQEEPAKTVSTTVALTPEMMSAQWPRFRGADGSGVSTFTNIPVKWDIESGENIGWKTPVPLPGHNSPVVWGNKLFLTGSQKSAREIFCFDTANGALLWRLPITIVPEAAVTAMEIPEQTGTTAATPTCDDQRVYAIFATGELVAADHNGRLVWSKNFGKLDNGYGHAISLVRWRDRLIVQLDQGHEPEAEKSRLYALDPATGNVVWQQKRAVGSSWGTPIIIPAADKEQIICLGEPWLISYDFNSGKELWKFDGLGSDLTPSPIFAAGLVIGISPSQRIIAIRPDGSGDITKTHVSWMIEENVPDIASPVASGGLLYTMETHGILICRDAATGKKLWEHTWEAQFQASPVIAGNRLYLSTIEGSTHVLECGREFKELAHNELREPIHATPAFDDGRMYVRGATNLYCLTVKGKTQ